MAGRLTRDRLDWMLVDHLAMHLGDLVSAEALYDSYRRWVVSKSPFATVEAELASIAASARVHRRVLEQRKDDPLGRFGKFAKAFDVSTTMPLVLYLATQAELGERLPDALHLIESYIVRRDLCGLPTNNYNRFFVEIIGKLRAESGDVIDRLHALLSSGTIDIARWPADEEWQGQPLSLHALAGGQLVPVAALWDGDAGRDAVLLETDIGNAEALRDRAHRIGPHKLMQFFAGEARHG